MTPRLQRIVWVTVCILVLFSLRSSVADDPQPPPAPDPPEFRAVVVLRPGEEQNVTVSWDRVDGGRLPCVHFTTGLGRPAETDYPDDGDRRELEGVSLTIDGERSGELFELLDTREFPSEPGVIVKVIAIAAGEDASPGTTDIYAHYISGTGRTTYRRAALRVVILPSEPSP